MEINKTLEERGQNYGSFRDNAVTSTILKATLKGGVRQIELSADQREALDLICTKLSRIVNGDPTYKDNWVDIAGYATLVANLLPDKEDT